MESLRKTAQEIVNRYHVSGLPEREVAEEESGYRVSARKNFRNRSPMLVA